MKNVVKRMSNDMIYVEKVGDQTGDSMRALFDEIFKIGLDLRTEGKPVLVLSNATNEGKTNIEGRKVGAEIGKTWDFDKSATYGSSLFLHKMRDMMVEATQLDQKVGNFETRQQAEAWLLQ